MATPPAAGRAPAPDAGSRRAIAATICSLERATARSSRRASAAAGEERIDCAASNCRARSTSAGMVYRSKPVADEKLDDEAAAAACPCGSAQPLDRCCGPLLDGAAAATAEALMRSRYSAHVLGRVDYIVETHDPATRGRVDRAAVERWARDSQWLGLQILARVRGGAADEDGVVEFTASYRAGGAARVHHERSRFRRHHGRWCYVDGDIVALAPVRRAPSVGRNDPCPCGSGKKHKRCCG
jgi:SEC-C motif-containing protein